MARLRPRPGLLLLLLALAPGAPARAETALVKAETLTLREKPDPKGGKLASLATFEPIKIKKRQDDWAQVETTGGKTGWVLSSFLVPRPYVTVKGANAAVRIGPAEKHDVVLEFIRHYPLRVLDRAEGGWLKIVDSEGDMGWVSDKQVEFAPWVVTTIDKECNVRKGPGTTNEVSFTCAKGVLLQAFEEKEGWIRVKAADGDEGWISGKIVFGWLEREAAPPKAEKPPEAEAKAEPTPKPKPKPPAKPKTSKPSTKKK